VYYQFGRNHSQRHYRHSILSGSSALIIFFLKFLILNKCFKSNHNKASLWIILSQSFEWLFVVHATLNSALTKLLAKPKVQDKRAVDTIFSSIISIDFRVRSFAKKPSVFYSLSPAKKGFCQWTYLGEFFFRVLTCSLWPSSLLSVNAPPLALPVLYRHLLRPIWSFCYSMHWSFHQTLFATQKALQIKYIKIFQKTVNFGILSKSEFAAKQCHWNQNLKEKENFFFCWK
jgi:hypothetical protein